MKRFTFVITLGTTVALCFAEGLLESKKTECTKDAYPPKANASVPKVIVNLDLPPEERWKELVALKRSEISTLQSELRNLGGNFIVKLIDHVGPILHKTLPSPYREELQSISDLTGIPLGEVVLYNVFYEFFTVCTSIVAQNAKGEILHARNLDFGLYLGWNSSSQTWTMTEVLRNTVVQIEWQRGGATVFYSVNFAGYIGILTGLNPGVMSFTVNERFNLNGGFIGIIQWLIFGQRDLQWLGFLARDILERGLTFDESRANLTAAKMIAPVYFILGGNKPGQGTILTKSQGVSGADEYPMATNKNGNWFVLETNYDQNQPPPFFDDRRTPGNKCMVELGQKNVSFEGLFNVLSTQPNLNKLTTYTTLMNVNRGQIESYIQKCEGNCPAW
ncbi:acid ceramidase-like [Varroa jacobsoni]|uniref:acid ceramidase-like n=1 Tax=Varroa jacobsoni TaxID=62625 RepID=UPI000BF2B25E|nr:acid ceramidase-like [Varroa jacobsoni]